MYGILVGEVGIPHRTALYEMQQWHIHQAITGYYRRGRDTKSLMRWQTYNMMAAFAGGDNLRKSGINGPSDLLKFPWDTDEAEQPIEVTDDVVKELQDEMASNPWIENPRP